MVRERGLEPPRPKAYAPKAYVYTNFTTRAWSNYITIYGRVLESLLRNIGHPPQQLHY